MINTPERQRIVNRIKQLTEQVDCFYDVFDKMAFVTEKELKNRQSFYDENIVPINDELRMLNSQLEYLEPRYEVGDGISFGAGTDSEAYTVIAVSKSGKKITVQRDKATMAPEYKPEFVAGGFAGHCTNNSEQRYTYERDEDGIKYQLTLRTKKLDPKYNEGRTKREYWLPVGWKTGQHVGATPGRSKFHDYNF